MRRIAMRLFKVACPVFSFIAPRERGFTSACLELVLLGVLLLLASPARAQSPETITLISGNGAIGTLDPLNQSSVDGGATWQQAHIVAKHPAWAKIPGTEYIFCGSTIDDPCGIGSSTLGKSTLYRTTFTLPAGFSNPSLVVNVHADNAAIVYLNGVEIGRHSCWGTFTCDGSQFSGPPETFSTSNASLFQVGPNILSFDLWDFGGVAGLDYKAVVTFTPPVPFAAFDAKVEIEGDEFEVKSTFTLDAGSDGIAPLTELAQLELTGGTGSFSTTIPAGSFEFQPAKFNKKGKQVKPPQFKFEGVIDGVTLEVKIIDLGVGMFEFKAEGKGANLTGIANPVTVTLTIGDDGGSITVEAEFE